MVQSSGAMVGYQPPNAQQQMMMQQQQQLDVVPFDPNTQKAGPGEMVLFDPASGGYFLQKNAGQVAMYGAQLDTEDDDEDDTPPWKLTQFIVNKTPKTQLGRVCCLVCFFVIFSAIGTGIAVSVVGSESIDNGGKDIVDPASPILEFFLNDVLANGIDFSQFVNTQLNQDYQKSYENTDQLGGSITGSLVSLGQSVKIPDFNAMLKNNNLTEYDYFNLQSVKKNADPNDYSHYDVQLLYVPPDTDSKQTINSNLALLEMYNKSTEGVTMDNIESQGLLKGLARIVKYEKGNPQPDLNEIESIYEGLILGPSKYYLFGRAITNAVNDVIKCVGWFNETQPLLFKGQGIVYKNS